MLEVIISYVDIPPWTDSQGGPQDSCPWVPTPWLHPSAQVWAGL